MAPAALMGRSTMSTSARLMISAFALLLAGCQSLEPAETLPRPLTGQVRRACGPADGPAIDFSLATPDRETTLSLFVWQGLPDQPTRLPVQRSGIDTFHGELCQSGSCQTIERLGMTIDPSQPGLVVGTLTLHGEQGTSLKAEFQAQWDAEPGPICG